MSSEMFVSTSLRILVNVESLNAVETVGNVSRHRVAPIVIPQDAGYTIKYVPAVSGESIGHGYQSVLADIALREGLPVGEFSARKEFLKYSGDSYLEGISPPSNHDDIRRFEVDVLLKDVVADVGGFLYTGKISVKRTSRLQVGYLLPALEDVTNAAAVEAQFHVRYLASQEQKREKTGDETRLGQAIYNIEAASALYTMTLNLDLSGVGVPSTQFGKKHEKERQLESQVPKRRAAALKALATLLGQISFGGKHARYLPNTELMSCVFTVSETPFTVTPGNFRNYIQRTSERLRKLSSILNSKNMVWAVIREKNLDITPEVKIVQNTEDIVAELIERLRQNGLVA
ncbi:MAG: type I-A CRISPR-associated protein Cas7/Csa2 [Candidatus Caldarchaeum sp.]